MKITRADVEVWSKERGLESIQVDGIPEGFSFKEPDLNIGSRNYFGKYVAYIPLSNWTIIYSPTIEQLIKEYNQNKQCQKK